jgi:hypothetical protein
VYHHVHVPSFSPPGVAILLYQKQTDEGILLFKTSEVAEDETCTPFRRVEIIQFLRVHYIQGG